MNSAKLANISVTSILLSPFISVSANAVAYTGIFLGNSVSLAMWPQSMMEFIKLLTIRTKVLCSYLSRI